MWWGKLIHCNTCNTARGWAARGWAEVSTTSASIRWIRPGYTYPDESSRVVVYCLKSHNMLGWFECMILWDYIWFYGWNLLCSSLPYFYCCVFCCVVLSFAMIINLLMWADARNTCGQQGWFHRIVSMGWTLFLNGFSLGLWPMYCLMLHYSTLICWISFIWFSVGIVVCLVL